MPFRNEHACRLFDPGKYRRFTRETMHSKTFNKSYSVLYGWFVKDGKEVSEIQAHRYPIKTWTRGEAARHCASRKGRFEAAKLQTQEMGKFIKPSD